MNERFHKYFDSLKEPDRFYTFMAIMVVGIWSVLLTYYFDFVSDKTSSILIMLFPIPLLISRLYYLKKLNKLGETNAPT